MKTTPSPLSTAQSELLGRFLETSSPDQVAWVSGYLAGLTASRGDAAPSTPQGSNGALTVLYGSQTGNGAGIAEALQQRAQERGIPVHLKDMGEYKTPHLKKEKHVAMIISTHGEGDPPDPAEELHAYLHGKRAPKLDHVDYAILALGDTSYDFFCKTGQDFDKALESLGASRILDRVDCDVDYESPAEQWIDQLLNAFVEKLPANGTSSPVLDVVRPGREKPAASLYTKKNPFGAVLLEQVRLNGRGSSKETYHIELSLEGSGLTYEPGDSLGVYGTNPPALVEGVLSSTGFAADECVHTHAGVLPLWEALTRLYELTTVTRPFLEGYSNVARASDLASLLGEERRGALKEFIYGRDVVDILQNYSINGTTPQEFVGLLRKMPARLYSIASSLDAHPDEVHLTVGATRFHAHGRDREGLCSTYLADRISDERPIPVYVDANRNFRLPTDPVTPVIMIGPGTGIAPFRAFVEERETRGASGKNWLFFGDQHMTTDFLYQTEWQKFLKDGVLTRMDVAFSRDQEKKVYVQHNMQKHRKELYAWLEEGAHLYVCGDESRMAHDVHDTLLSIVQDEGDLTLEEARTYVKKLQKEKRYQRDVY